MTTQFPWDTVLNIVFFAVGFIIGLAQLWQAQRFYLADQRNKFEQINNAVTQIAQRLAVIEGVTNRLVEIDRTLSTIGATSTTLQERLFGIVERQFSIGEQTGQVTVEASDEIKGLIRRELTDTSLVTPDKMSQVQDKLDRVLTELSTQLLRLTQASVPEDVAVEPTQTADLPGANHGSGEATFEVGKLRLDKSQGMAWLEGKALKLPPNMFKLLKLFMENPRRVISTEEMLNFVYGENSTASVNHIFVLISRLRREIDWKNAGLQIRTIAGRGYVLTLNHGELRQSPRVSQE